MPVRKWMETCVFSALFEILLIKQQQQKRHFGRFYASDMADNWFIRLMPLDNDHCWHPSVSLSHNTQEGWITHISLRSKALCDSTMTPTHSFKGWEENWEVENWLRMNSSLFLFIAFLIWSNAFQHADVNKKLNHNCLVMQWMP